jgi:formylglycine-generating enzyme required for sulfatase activity
MFRKTMVRGLMVAALVASAVTVRASTIPMATVPVGNAGNPADTTTGLGAVGYDYDIGTYDVTLTQYTAFLNSVASTDTYGLYNPSMASDLQVAGISRSGSPGSYTYAVIGDGQRPVTYVSWYDAVRFVNWLTDGNTETGAYTITNGGNNSGTVTVPTTAQRAAWSGGSTTYWYLPDQNEWYKAAYYDSNIASSNKYWLYPTKSDSAPTNNVVGSTPNSANFYVNGVYAVTQSPSLSLDQNYLTDVGAYSGSPGPYGTFDQCGDVAQWNDGNPDVSSFVRDLRGGSWLGNSNFLSWSSGGGNVPSTESDAIGFRVASSVAVSEPTSIALLFAGAVGLLALARRRKAHAT